MRLRVVLRCGLLATVMAAIAHAQPGWPTNTGTPGWPNVKEVRLRHGDDPAWARPDHDERDWERTDFYGMPSRDGIYWVRFRIKRGVENAERPRDAISFSVVASYEVYWDGRLIGHNGVPGASAAAEEPGSLDNIFRIPGELDAPGEHVVALRMSSWHTGFSSDTFALNFWLFPLRDYLQERTRTAAFSLVAVGGALLAAIVFGLMWLLVERRAALGRFAAVCLSAAVMQALQSWRGLQDYPYSWHQPRLLAIALMVVVLGLLLVAFLESLFGLKRSWPRLAVLAAMMALAWWLAPFYNGKSVAASGCAFLMALGVTVAAVGAGRRGAVFVLMGLAVSCVQLLVTTGNFLEQSFLFSFGASMLGCVTALTLQLRDDRRAAERARITATRLELELLKKNLQPHFLLNTLTTIIEVIEQEPKLAVGLIEELAHEFRILARVAGEKLILLGHELELCRAHLKIMSLRKRAQCSLEVGPGVDERDLVPPALFHTLIENGLTHLLPRNGEQRFELRAVREPGRVRYTLVAHGEPSDRERTPTFAPLNVTMPAVLARPVARREGTGLRYLKARLEESFPGRWILQGEAIPEGWRTVIEIENVARPGARPAGRSA